MSKQKITINVGTHYPAYKEVFYDSEHGKLSFDWGRINPLDNWDMISEEGGMRQNITNRYLRYFEEEKNFCLDFERRTTQDGHVFKRIETNPGFGVTLVSYEIDVPSNLTPRDIVRTFCEIVHHCGMLVDGR